jgi:hypothetical protein
MATGDITSFQQARLNIGKGLYDLSADTLKLGIIKSLANGGHDPAAADADPHWGGTGTTNLATHQVATAGTSYTGPQTLGSVTFTLVSGTATLRAANVSLSTDASGFTNGRWGILYDDTDANKRALAFVDFGADISIAAAPLLIDWSGASGDILTIA